ncbi:hypothetical protein RHMOL_Rhmol06G0223000 [Rhododendron molle]|uniref:Uncharacterized protein n=1 Tax=Rhododendron molle TaxID=49168 RepID=A0ACC0NF76_RHOML|nr:hypothetical protein RHMOL_Rhmol06G0223000 [Rhododendron molle]
MVIDIRSGILVFEASVVAIVNCNNQAYSDIEAKSWEDLDFNVFKAYRVGCDLRLFRLKHGKIQGHTNNREDDQQNESRTATDFQAFSETFSSRHIRGILGLA